MESQTTAAAIDETTSFTLNLPILTASYREDSKKTMIYKLQLVI